MEPETPSSTEDSTWQRALVGRELDKGTFVGRGSLPLPKTISLKEAALSFPGTLKKDAKRLMGGQRGDSAVKSIAGSFRKSRFGF